MYKEKFESAIKGSKKLGLKVPAVMFCDKSVLSQKPLSGLSNTVAQAFEDKGLYLDEIYRKCIYVHHLLKEPLSQFYATDVYYTIGYVMVDNEVYHKISEEEIASTLRDGVQQPSLNIHTWLTLPSMEIIDLVFLTNYFRARNQKHHDGSITARHADRLTEGMKYVPTLVGDDFLLKTNIL